MSPYRRYRRTDPRRYITHARLLGRRGAYLLILGGIWLCEAALTYLTHGPIPGFWLLSHGWQLQCAGWAVGGLVAVWAAFRRQGRDAPGWVAAFVMAFFVAVAILDGIVETALDGAPVRTLIVMILQGAVNYGILGWILIVAGWREPVELPSFEKEDDQ